MLELSKEMISVESYLADAKLVVEKQFGRFVHLPAEVVTTLTIEVARLIQLERQKQRKPRPEKVPPKQPATDQLMSKARSNPQVPPMVHSSPEEVQAPPKRSHTRKAPVVVTPPPRVRKPKPKVESKKSSRRR